jgi:hypothetical protein
VDAGWLADNGEKAGIIGTLSFVIVSFFKGWIVTSGVHADVCAERDLLRKKLEEANARDLARLERVESSLNDALRRPL